MSTVKKVFLGLLSVLPLVMLVIYMNTFFSVMMPVFRHAGQPELIQEAMMNQIMDNIAWIVATGLLMGITSLSALIYFLVHAINNTAIDSSERLVWILVFIFAGVLAKPVYWYMRIWKQPAPVANGGTGI